MTIIDGIDVCDINYINNEIQSAIKNNDTIEDNLNVIIVISNPCNYKRRYTLAKEFINRMQNTNNVNLYIVELAYNDQKFEVTNEDNKRHLQIRTSSSPLWHKENMINLGVKYLLPDNWKSFAWIDADIEFDNKDWALNTLKILNGCRDIVQIYSHCLDLDQYNDPMNVFYGFGFQYTKRAKYNVNYWHPGFGWAITRKAYEKLQGLYELSILGAGDYNMALSLIGNGVKSINENMTNEYKQSIKKFENNAKTLRLGYVPGIIRHYFHGSKKNRKYSERWKILLKYQYNPYEHIKKDEIGLLIPTEKCPKELLEDIQKYFEERNEDEFFE